MFKFGKIWLFQDRIALHDIAQKYNLTEEMVKSLLKKKMQPRNGAASQVVMKYNLFLQTDYSERKVKRLKSVMVSSLSIDCR